MGRYTLAREIATLIPESSGTVRSHLQQARNLLLRSSETGISDKQLTALPPGGELSDPIVPGLMAIHSRRHGIKWVLRTRKPFDRFVPLGLYPETSCEAARQAARDVKAGNLRPSTAEQKAAETASQRPSAPIRLRDIVQLYLDQYPFGSKSNERHSKGNLEKLIKTAGNPRVSMLTRSVVRDLLVEIERDRVTQAAVKTRNALSRCWQFNQGVLKERRLTASGALIDLDQQNPAIGLQFESTKEQFPLTAQEMGNYWNNLPKCQAIPGCGKDALLLLSLTIARVNEVAGIRTRDVNLEDDYIELATTKSGGSHRLYLSNEARRIVERNYDEDNEWLFPAARGSNHIHANTLNAFVRENVGELGIERIGEDLKLKRPANCHAIRRFGYTWMQEQGINQGVIDRAVNHRPRSLAKTYGWSAHLWPQVRKALDRLDRRYVDALLFREI
jgi:integrase